MKPNPYKNQLTTLKRKGSSDTEARIRNAALNLFTKKGIKGTTTREIATKAGIAEGTIYKHFKSKEELAVKLFLHCMDAFTTELLESIRELTDPRDKIAVLIKSFFYFAKKEPKIYSYIMVVHHTELGKVLKQIEPKPKDVFSQVIREGIQSGYFRKMDENLAAALVIGMMTRVILFYERGLITMGYTELISEVVEAAFRVLNETKSEYNI